MRSAGVVVLSFALSLIVSVGCARVKPHQRELLSHPAMQQPPEKTVHARDQHMFQVREGTRGATGTAGGGCGCN